MSVSVSDDGKERFVDQVVRRLRLAAAANTQGVPIEDAALARSDVVFCPWCDRAVPIVVSVIEAGGAHLLTRVTNHATCDHKAAIDELVALALAQL